MKHHTRIEYSDVRGVEEGMIKAIEYQNLIEEVMIVVVEPEDSNEVENEMEESTNPKENNESEKKNVGSDSLLTTKYNLRPD
jgi:hypothetical protein